MAKPVTIPAATTRFSELVRRAEAGEEIMIARGDKPAAKLMPVGQQTTIRREPGRLKGLIALDDAFWEPLSDEELERRGMK